MGKNIKKGGKYKKRKKKDKGEMTVRSSKIHKRGQKKRHRGALEANISISGTRQKSHLKALGLGRGGGGFGKVGETKQNIGFYTNTSRHR